MKKAEPAKMTRRYCQTCKKEVDCYEGYTCEHCLLDVRGTLKEEKNVINSKNRKSTKK